MTIASFLDTLRSERGSAILRCQDQEVAARAMDAAHRGGFRVLEFTLTIPGAFELIQDFSRRPDCWVGAGTVLEVAEAEKAVASGARFLVSPVVDPQVIRAAQDLGVAAMPGTHTPTEMLLAHRSGAPLQKLFPAPGLGPAYVSSCLAPLPFLRLVPTNGVDESNALAWLDAGAFALGFVKPLFDPKDLAQGRYDRIEERARRIRALLAGWQP
jgi:Entner-Doudoroff aldolase